MDFREEELKNDEWEFTNDWNSIRQWIKFLKMDNRFTPEVYNELESTLINIFNHYKKLSIAYKKLINEETIGENNAN